MLSRAMDCYTLNFTFEFSFLLVSCQVLTEFQNPGRSRGGGKVTARLRPLEEASKVFEHDFGLRRGSQVNEARHPLPVDHGG